MSKAIAAGSAMKVQPYLNAIDDLLDAAGVRNFTARELTKLRKAPGEVYAIPPREYWPRLADVCKHVAEPLRARVGKPLRVLNGYRPRDYNAAVDGAPNSSHLWGWALDLSADADGDGDVDTADGRILRAHAADLFVELAPPLLIGIGFYLSRVHVEWGRRRIAYASKGSTLDDRELEAARARAVTRPICVRDA